MRYVPFTSTRQGGGRMVEFKVEDNFEELQKKISTLQEKGEEIVNDVLHKEASQIFQDSIQNLLPESHRKWNGKKRAVKQAKPFTSIGGNLSVTIVNKNAYAYLYFPDDGTNTKRHRGEQHFMLRGVEAKAGTVVEMCLNRLTEQINKL